MVAHLAPQRVQIGREQLHDAEGALRMDTGDGEERAVAVRARQPADVSHVVRAGRITVLSRPVGGTGPPVDDGPGPRFRALPAQYGILRVGVPHLLRHARAADDDQAVTVEVDFPAHRDVLRGDVETVRPREIFETLAQADVVHGDDRSAALVVPPQRSRDDDRSSPEEGPFWRRSGMTDLVNPPAAQPGLLGDLRVREPLGVKILNHAPTEPGELGHLLLRVGQPGRHLAQEQVRIIDRRDPLQLVRHEHTS